MKGKCPPAEKGFFVSLDRKTNLLPTEDGWVFDATPSNLSELEQHGTAAATVGGDSKRSDADDDESPLPVPACWRLATAGGRITKGAPRIRKRRSRAHPAHRSRASSGSCAHFFEDPPAGDGPTADGDTTGAEKARVGWFCVGWFCVGFECASWTWRRRNSDCVESA